MQHLDQGFNREHQPVMHIDKIKHFLSLPLAPCLSLVFDSLSCLVISVCFSGYNTDLSRVLCLSSVISSHRHARESLQHQRCFIHTVSHIKMEFCLYVPVSLDVCASLPLQKNTSMWQGVRTNVIAALKSEEKKEKNREERKAEKRKEKCTCWHTYQCNDFKVHIQRVRESRSSEVIICKKWITLRLDCWAQWRAGTRYAWWAPSRTLQYTSKLSSCRLLDTFASQGSQNGVIKGDKGSKCIQTLQSMSFGLSKQVLR